MMLHRALLLVEVCLLRCGTNVTPVTSESCTFEAWSCWSRFRILPGKTDRSTHGFVITDNWYTEGVIALWPQWSYSSVLDLVCTWSSLASHFCQSPTHWHSSRYAFRKVSQVEEWTCTSLCVHVCAFKKRIWLSPREHLQHKTCESVTSFWICTAHRARISAYIKGLGIHDWRYSANGCCTSLSWTRCRGIIATTFFSQHPGRDRECPRRYLVITTFLAVTAGTSWSRPPSSWTRVRVA